MTKKIQGNKKRKMKIRTELTVSEKKNQKLMKNQKKTKKKKKRKEWMTKNVKI